MRRHRTRPDADLAARALAGDRAAMGALLDRHYDLMFRVAFRALGRRDAAEDVAQDVCVKLARGLANWSREGRFETWLYRVVLNAAHDAGRRLARDGRLRDEWAREPRETVTGSDDDRADTMWRAVRRLPPAQAEAITLVYGEGLSHAEAAATMGCATATVGYHVHAARTRLREMMEEEAA
ncbi:MAG: RNA polymerase sigma factor [Pseudomonadota bacterium]